MATKQLAGQTAVVTGGNTGIGLQICFKLLDLGVSTLILGSRNPSRGQQARIALRAQHPRADIQLMPIELDNYSTLTRFATMLRELPRVDIVILNAGVYRSKFERTEGILATGHETTIQVNYLSNAILATLLLPVLVAKAGQHPARLTLVGADVKASDQPKAADSVLEVINNKSKFDGATQFKTSKVLLENIASYLARQVDANQVIVNVADPGSCHGTEIYRTLSGMKDKLFITSKRVGSHSAADGAKVVVNATVTQGVESHGSLVQKSAISRPLLAADPAVETRLWADLKKELSGEELDAALAACKTGQ